jgi:putative copper export protein
VTVDAAEVAFEKDRALLVRYRRLVVPALVLLFAGAYGMFYFRKDLFGAGTWGAGGNLVAWVVCGTISFGSLHAVLHARHLAVLAQARLHHRERMDQADRHHEEMKDHVTEAVNGR